MAADKCITAVAPVTKKTLTETLGNKIITTTDKIVDIE